MIKKIINCGLSLNVCNFRCHYCYVGQTCGYSNENPELPYSVDTIKRALSYQRMGGACLVNLCGAGETMMAPYIIELTHALLEEGHYVTLVTNGSITKKYDELVQFEDELIKHLFVKVSFHYMELKRLGLLQTYFNNIRKLKNRGVSFSVELTANDESIPYIPEIKEICQKELGAWCHIIESRDDTTEALCRLTKRKESEHLREWESFDSPLIHFQKKTWGHHRNEFCYAGDWLWNVDLWSGDITICLKHGKKIGNIYDAADSSVHGAAIGKNCPWAHCFSSYFLMTNGIIPELDTPYYGELRDRICSDGSRWLQPEVSDFFHSKLVDSNTVYTDEKKEFINFLMAAVYDNVHSKPDYSRLGNMISAKLKSECVQSAVLFLDDRLSASLLDFVLNVFNCVSIKINYQMIDIQELDRVANDTKYEKYIVVNYPMYGKYIDHVTDVLLKNKMIPVTEIVGGGKTNVCIQGI